MAQKLAPAEKNSTNWLARLARFCNSEHGSLAYPGEGQEGDSIIGDDVHANRGVCAE